MLDSILKSLVDDLRKGSNREVEKSIPMKKEWTTKLNAVRKLFKESNIAKQKAMRGKQAFWALVEEDTGMYDRDFQLSDNYKELEILVEKD